MASNTRDENITKEWKIIPITTKSVIIRKSGEGVMYRLGDSSVVDGIELCDSIAVDSNISLRTISGSAVVTITTVV